MGEALPKEQHNVEIYQNLENWKRKPLLQKIYKNFHKLIASHINTELSGITAELGSGIGNIKEVIPNCIRTDLFANPWIDQTENAYSLSFNDKSVSNLILFDVFHHLRHPGVAFNEFARVMQPGGRVIIFDPCMSLLGVLVYGLLHHEPIALGDRIEWFPGAKWNSSDTDYYAAQGNATRVFINGEGRETIEGDWKLLEARRFSAISYVLSGGYSKPALFPQAFLPALSLIEKVLDLLPIVFATRLLVVLERRG